MKCFIFYLRMYQNALRERTRKPPPQCLKCFDAPATATVIDDCAVVGRPIVSRIKSRIALSHFTTRTCFSRWTRIHAWDEDATNVYRTSATQTDNTVDAATRDGSVDISKLSRCIEIGIVSLPDELKNSDSFNSFKRFKQFSLAAISVTSALEVIL